MRLDKTRTEAGLGFLRSSIEAWFSPIVSNTAQTHGRQSPQAKQISEAYNSKLNFNAVLRLGALDDAEPSRSTENASESAFVPIANGWESLVHQHLATFGNHGLEAAGSVAEVLLKSTAIGRAIGGAPLLYRGESEYGWPLLSRVGRALGAEPDWGPISEFELDELARFKAAAGRPGMTSAMFPDGIPPASPMGWLAAMQHYDDFGTRMIDVSTSVFAGLYFACVDWNGEIDETVDGRLYCFQGRGAKRDYIPATHRAALRSDEAHDLQPEHDETKLFDLPYPEIYRVIYSPQRNERLLAQDGLFLLPAQSGTGWGQNFELRIPASAKRTIATELWQAGYTPNRIVRGQSGEDAQSRVEQQLGDLLR